jgi:hypothetical protein
VVRIAISCRFRADFFGCHVVSTVRPSLVASRGPRPSSQIPFDCHSTCLWAERWCDLEAMNFDKKDEDSGAVFHLDKTQVFQDARTFNASPIQPKCRIILTVKVLDKPHKNPRTNLIPTPCNFLSQRTDLLLVFPRRTIRIHQHRILHLLLPFAVQARHLSGDANKVKLTNLG